MENIWVENQIQRTLSLFDSPGMQNILYGAYNNNNNNNNEEDYTNENMDKAILAMRST